MVNLLLSPEKDLRKSHVVKTIYDPACGTGGMLSVSEKYIRTLNADAQPMLYGQDWNDEAWAVCKSDMLIKGEDADNICPEDTFTKDGFDRDDKGKKFTFDYMLANPPFGVEWNHRALRRVIRWQMADYHFTEYFEKEVLRKRTYLKKEWCIRVLEHPLRSEPQENNRYRFWGEIPELEDRYLRVITLEDKVTIHNAFPDRRFKP